MKWVFFSEITAIFAKHGVSFEKILQLPNKMEGQAEIVLVTHKASLYDYEQIMEKLYGLGAVKEINSSYRVEGSTNA